MRHDIAVRMDYLRKLVYAGSHGPPCHLEEIRRIGVAFRIGRGT